MHYSFDIQGHGYFPHRYLSCSEIASVEYAQKRALEVIKEDFKDVECPDISISLHCDNGDEYIIWEKKWNTSWNEVCKQIRRDFAGRIYPCKQYGNIIEPTMFDLKGFDLYSINQRISRIEAKKNIMLWSYLFNSSRIFNLVNVEED